MVSVRKRNNSIKNILLIAVILIIHFLIINEKENHRYNKGTIEVQTLSTKNSSSFNTPEEQLGKKRDEIEDSIPVFKYSSLSDDVKERIVGVSWRENSPVKLEELSYINVTYWGFDDKEHIGEMIVNKELAQEVIEIFKELYEAKYPIEKIKLIDEYNADDSLSMADNNTSAFCFREVTGQKGVFSQHSYGVAIDINPIQNPYVKGDVVLPEEGIEYLDRTNIRKGMITVGDPCYNAFKSRGWTWGGEWNSLKDYQHFEKEI